MHIGLIGGIGPAATDFYYRRIIAALAAKKTEFDLTIVHADTPTLLRHLLQNDVAAQVAIYAGLSNRLVAAGAECVVVTSIGGHFCIRAFEEVSPLPVVNIITEVSQAVAARGLKRLGILGTRTAMETRFYNGIPTAEVIPPHGPDLDAVHDAYVAMAAAGVITSAQRTVFESVGAKLIREHGAEAIMLGGTDLALAFDESSSPFPILDCAAIHVDAIVSRVKLP